MIQHRENPNAKQILGCVLADLMGMGKTLELILLVYFLYYIAKNQKEVDELVTDGYYVTDGKVQKTRSWGYSSVLYCYV